jgi:hypothetical protein
MHVEETELSAFVNAVKEMFGSEQVRHAAEDWLDESEADGWTARLDRPAAIGERSRSRYRLDWQIGGTADRLNVGPQGVRLPIASPDTRH